MPAIRPHRSLLPPFSILPGFALLIASALAFAEPPEVPPATRRQILLRLNQNAESLNALKASLVLGVPHPTAGQVQSSNALIAFRKKPAFLYLKAYQPLAPLYFLLKSDPSRFWLFFPRLYTVYQGAHAVLEQNPDIEFKIIGGDILWAMAPAAIEAGEPMEWKQTETGYQLTFYAPDGSPRKELTFDRALDTRTIVEYNPGGFRARQARKNDWRQVGACRLPFEIKIKRFVPRPNDLVLRFDEIRLSETLGPDILDHQFPEDVTYQELTA